MPVRAGLGADPVTVVENLAGLDAVRPVPLDPFPVLGMHRIQPAAPQVLLQALAGDPAPLRGVLRDLARRRGHPDDLGTGLDQGAVTLLAPAYRLLGVAALGDVDGDQCDPGDLSLRVVRGKPGERPVPGLRRGRGIGAGGAGGPVGPAIARGRAADALVRLEKWLVISQDVVDGGLGAGGEGLGPDLGGKQPEVVGAVAAVQPGQAAVDPPETQVGPEEGEADRRLTQQCRQQRRIGDIQASHSRLRHGCVCAHEADTRPVSEPAIQRLLPAHCGHKQASVNKAVAGNHPCGTAPTSAPQPTAGVIAVAVR